MVDATFRRVRRLVEKQWLDNFDRMSYLTIFFDQMSYWAKCHVDQKSYATNCRIGEMVFDELSCTHQITLGLDLRLNHLKLLVECAKRAMSWSTCRWILLSHNSLLYHSLLCGTLSKAFAKSIMIKYVFLCPRFTAPSRLLMMSCTNQTNWVSQDLWNHADSQQVCDLRLSVCWCYWLSLVYALGFCSRCMWATLVYS